VLDIEFRVTAPFTHGEIPLPPPPRVIQYDAVPRYIVTKLIRFRTARKQERFWEDNIPNTIQVRGRKDRVPTAACLEDERGTQRSARELRGVFAATEVASSSLADPAFRKHVSDWFYGPLINSRDSAVVSNLQAIRFR
jgi:hypothetical protein